MKERALIIDQLNIFIQNWMVNPSLSANGVPIGGIFGTLRSLTKMIREIEPTRVIVVWDGEGGSQKRKGINKGYKEGRSPLRKNYDSPLSKKESLENQVWQQTRLVEIYNLLPVEQYCVNGTEADDVIAHICRSSRMKGIQKVIASSDKDFIQLLNEETILYRPVKKEFLTSLRVTDEEKIHPNNFALAKAIVGDKSDNVIGVRGVGWKTLTKNFPFISGSGTVLLQEVIDYAKKNQDKGRIYEKVSDAIPQIKENYKLVNLTPPMISSQDGIFLNESLEDPCRDFDSEAAVALLDETGLPTEKLIEFLKQMKNMENK